MQKVIWGIVVIAIIIWIGVSFSERTPENTNEDVIRVGAVLSFTGDANVDSLRMQRGFDLAQEDLAQQGINVEIQYEDDETNPAQTISAVRKLLDTYKPDALVGLSWSFLAEAASPVVTEAKIPVFSPANTSEFTGKPSPYIFFGAVRNEQKLEPVVEWLKQKEITSVALFVDNAPWGNNHRDIYTRAAQEAGVEVVLLEEFIFGTEGEVTSAAVTKIKASEADALLWSGGEQGAVILLKKMQEQQVHIPVVGMDHLENIIKKQLVDYSVDIPLFVFETSLDQELDRKHQKKYGEPVGIYTDTAYDGLMLMVEAIQNTDRSGEKIAEYLQTKTNYEGFAKTYSFDENGDVEGGEWFLKEVE